jgi:hypothetical protein
VRADGFTGVALPLAVHGTDLVFPNGSVPLAGLVGEIAEIAGVDAGPPDGALNIDDAAATEHEVSYGVSAGDDFHPTPYAYVGPSKKPTEPFWNAPFGAVYPLNPAHDADALTSRIADFFERGRRQLPKRS